MTRSPALERRPHTTSHGFEVRHHALEGGGAVIVASGELDLATSPALKSALLELVASGERRFLLDLTDVTHMDSTGLAVLIGFQERMLPEGGELVLTASEAVRLVFQMTGVDGRFTLCAAVDEALAAWGTARADELELRDLSEDAAMAVGLASTALPFAETRGAEGSGGCGSSACTGTPDGSSAAWS